MNSSNAFDKIARLQENELSVHQPALAQTKQSLMQQVRDSSEKRRSARFWLALAAAMVLLTGGGVGAYLFFRSDVGLSPATNAPSRWLVAPANGSESMEFADGSTLRLLPGAAARVLQTAPHRVRVLVEKGRADVQVTPTRKTAWMLEAGPYVVRVTGTRFSISWDASAERFELWLKKGSVVVTGPMLEEGKVVRKGERVAASVREKRIEITGTAASHAPSVLHPGEANPVGESTARVADAQRRKRTPLQSAVGKHHLQSTEATTKLKGTMDATTSWSDLCAQGAFKEVVRRARARGVQTVIRTGSLADLMALGDAARLTRNRAISTDVYQTVRVRFGTTPQAAVAAFYLGKMAFDQQHAFGVAAKWLHTYLQESPNGTFTRDALGKLMEAQHKSGQGEAAHRNAQRYLRQYPDGVHVDVARNILGQK